MLGDLLSYNGSNSLSFVVFTMFLGAAVACAVMLYHIKIPGKMVRALSKAGANSPEKAIGAAECGITSERLLRFILSEGSALSKYVRILPTETVKKGKKELSVLKSAKFYLEEETRVRAELRYDGRNANLLTVTVGVLLLAVLAFAAVAIIPDLVQMLKNFIGMFKQT